MQDCKHYNYCFSEGCCWFEYLIVCEFKSRTTQIMIQSQRSNSNSVNIKSQSVANFYAGQSVFVTGGTGLLGKVLIEKLLYSCKDIRNIFILIRSKKDIKAEERIQQLIDKPLFSRLKAERPEDLNKIIPIIGDLTQPGLSLSYADKKLLIDNVSIVFHVAATVKFNEELDLAVKINVEGTRSVLNICHDIQNIKAFVYVSTTYNNPKEKILEEKIYPPHISLNEVLLAIKDQNNHEKKIMKGLPNTYTLTKNLAEHLVVNYRGTIPAVIVRPSIISPSYREPLTGWIDSWGGATGLVAATMKGINRVILGDKNNILDIIPIDFVTNTIIVAAAKCLRLNDVTVYHSCTSSCNPISIMNFTRGLTEASIRTGFNGNARISVTYTKWKLIVYILTFVLQILPAYIADLYLYIRRRKPIYKKMQSKIITGREVLDFYTSNSWEFKADNVKSLHNSLSNSEKKVFPCDASEFDWNEYTSIFIDGIRTYLMK